jgi:hypothetical protein
MERTAKAACQKTKSYTALKQNYQTPYHWFSPQFSLRLQMPYITKNTFENQVIT